jgi:hypothetical protein
MVRTPRSHNGQCGAGRRRLSPPESEYSPNQEREAKIFKRIVVDDKVEAVAKNDPGDGEQAGE